MVEELVKIIRRRDESVVSVRDDGHDRYVSRGHDTESGSISALMGPPNPDADRRRINARWSADTQVSSAPYRPVKHYLRMYVSASFNVA